MFTAVSLFAASCPLPRYRKGCFTLTPQVPVAFALHLPSDCDVARDLTVEPALGTVAPHSNVPIRLTLLPSVHQM